MFPFLSFVHISILAIQLFLLQFFFTIDIDSEIEPISLTLVQTLKPTSLYTLQKYMGIKILGIKIQMALFFLNKYFERFFKHFK